MRDFVSFFRYGGSYYRCIPLQFRWGRSALWFVKMLRPLVKNMRDKMKYPVLPYLDDLLTAPTAAGTMERGRDLQTDGKRLGDLIERQEIERHPEKGSWDGARKFDHLGVHVDTEAMRVFVTVAKVERLRRLARNMVLMVQRNLRLVPLELVRHFCGMCVSLVLELTLKGFYNRSLYFDMTITDKKSDAERDLGRRPSCRRLGPGIIPVSVWEG